MTQIAGLLDAKPNIKGQLTMSDTALGFSSPGFTAQIPFTRITSVSTGDIRIETGGTTGRIVRQVIPFGGGMAVATVTQKAVDLLTIEYEDPNGGYHGAVFYVPKLSAKILSDRAASQLSTMVAKQPPACDGIPSSSTSIVVEPIAARVELPAEYRVLLYEALIKELSDSKPPITYIRAGRTDAGAGCSAMKLKITVTGFKKGNQALRASTGPIGLFVGKTSLSFHVELTSANGRCVLAKDMTDSKRMDSESLGVANDVAKSVSKKIRKLPVSELAT